MLNVKLCGRLEAPSTFTQPYGSILIQSVKMQLLEPHHEKRHAPREHNAYGANSCYGCGSALCPLYEPIKASGHSKSKCMSPPSQVQRHKCRDKKCYGKCEEGEPKVCKYGYPREFCNKDLAKSTITGRNIYRCEKKEDQRLSPYIPLWLLATGLNTLTPLVLAYVM